VYTPRLDSFYATWDDHEVTNDYDGKTVNPSLYRRARQAFFEYMPLFDSGFPVDTQCAGDPLFRVFRWGKDVDVIMLDTRSCRSPRARAECELGPGISDPTPTLPASLRVSLGLPPEPPSRCLAAITDPSRTMLGSAQKERFKATLISSTAKFKFVVSQVPIQQFYAMPYDRWEGYAAERNELLNFIRSNRVANVVFLSTDIHANLINEVFIDRFTDGQTVAQEFVTGPIAEDTLQASILAGGFGPLPLLGLNTLLTTAGVDCRNLDKYSFGVIEVDAATGTASIALRDEAGGPIRDQLIPAVTCAKTLGP
jgi:alkaline phosphatase D